MRVFNLLFLGGLISNAPLWYALDAMFFIALFWVCSPRRGSSGPAFQEPARLLRWLECSFCNWMFRGHRDKGSELSASLMLEPPPSAICSVFLLLSRETVCFWKLSKWGTERIAPFLFFCDRMGLEYGTGECWVLIQKQNIFWCTIFSASLRLSFLIWEMGGKQSDRVAVRIKWNNTREVLNTAPGKSTAA